MASAASTPEWVEIIEPRTQEHMFANLTTGECVWDPPEGVPVKKTNSNQWWELFDQNTARFYYYNAVSQKTVWHRPTDCDIIPLAKLQTLKQNTEVKTEEPLKSDDPKGSSQSTQTASVLLDRLPKKKEDANPKTKMSVLTSMQTSPVSSPRMVKRTKHYRSHYGHHPHHRHRRTDSDYSDIRVPVQSHSPSSDEFKHQPSRRSVRSKSSRRQSQESLAQSPEKATSQRFLHFEHHPTSPDDKRRTTIGPAQAKYYSIPHRGDPSSNHVVRPNGNGNNKPLVYAVPSGKLRNQMIGGTENVMDSHFGGYAAPNSSISRSASFMSRQPSRGLEDGSNGMRPWYDVNNGRRSVESTPQSHRRLKDSPESNHSGSFYANSARSSDIGSPIEGYCTPLTNRRHNSFDANKSSKRNLFSESHSSHSPVKDSEQQPLSISQLVDSGLSALTESGHDTSPHRHGQARSRGSNGNQQQSGKISKQPVKPQAQPRIRRPRHNGTLERAQWSSNSSKMSPLQQYILEQAKLSGYCYGDPVDGDRDSYIESEDDWIDRQDDSDDFADDEDGGVSDDVSKASSVDGEDGRFLSEPTYNNLDPVWLQSVQNYQTHYNIPAERPVSRNTNPPASSSTHPNDIDAFSEEFDIRMRFSHHRTGGGSNQQSSSSTMPRPASHQPTSSLQQQQQQNLQNPAFPVPYDVLHPSLQRNTHSLIDTSAGSSSTLRGSTNNNNTTSRSHSRAQDHGSMLSVSASIHSAISCESDIEKYAQDNLNIQKKGLFRKKMTVKDILTHTKESIRKPLTCLSDKVAKKEAIELFRLLQIYMGDRRAKPNMTINSVALDITNKGYSKTQLRDEIFVQLCKQTTENVNSRESLRRGWELMAICLTFFPPSTLFAPALHSYIQKHRDPAFDYPDVGKWPIHVQISHYAGICAKRLDRIGDGGRLIPKKPSIEEIDQSRLQIFRPSMFGGTLQEALDMQKDRFPQRRLPWLLTVLAEQIMQLNGARTEGIFRVPADVDEVSSMKNRFDQWEVPVCVDCHTAASLLKLWLRELYEPVIPYDLYDMCICMSENEKINADEVMQRMPEANKDVLLFLIRYLQMFSRPDISSVTKMDASNLGTVFAPNFLRCTSKDPMVIMENTRKEMAFIKSLILNLDTSSMEGVV